MKDVCKVCNKYCLNLGNHIIEHHIDDFTSGNFGSVVASHGGFKNYAKSIGGIFYDYYGENLKIKKVYEFQRVSEYVFGYMTMFGFDYYNGVDGMDINDVMYCKWGGSCMQMADYERAVAEAEKKSSFKTASIPKIKKSGRTNKTRSKG